ncbi:uncharacterized protein C8Q71DRAFT_791606 [Rhodofomes roseus]|uniref:Secreted protein n=1 Tax=Rhodofomes roseus TaxID=34475 RepID=A0ABQ8JXV8_9APHY|nr:uncharacterized protein C8Q71DRAFT_791606 [Rhodofomes roseus]KAH9829076.1 hypothetical protein C8Q71DRAFT_791606 [Rhodofomes roseus]
MLWLVIRLVSVIVCAFQSLTDILTETCGMRVTVDMARLTLFARHCLARSKLYTAKTYTLPCMIWGGEWPLLRNNGRRYESKTLAILHQRVSTTDSIWNYIYAISMS